jgi:hypothetical protein
MSHRRISFVSSKVTAAFDYEVALLKIMQLWNNEIAVKKTAVAK